jgi:hypothetical protein
MLILAPLLVAAFLFRPAGASHWSAVRWDSARLLPDPASHPDALVRVMAARAWGWKGVVAVHCWIVIKDAGATAYERYDVVGWGVGQGRPAIRRDIRIADGFWAGNRPRIVGGADGDAAASVIPRLRAAIASYPFDDHYTTWPGPNSNTFVAYLLRHVPELGIAMPPTAIGKDFLVDGVVARAPSGTGYAVSLFGVLGLTLAPREGVELNLLGLVIGIDPADLALKLPGIGQVGLR